MLEIQKFPSIEELHTFLIQGNTRWMTPIMSYLKDEQLLLDLNEARKIKKRATRFTLLNDILYKHDEAKYILNEVHKGVCGYHSGAWSLVSKITRTGYFWPMVRKEAKDFIKKSDKCQRYENF